MKALSVGSNLLWQISVQEVLLAKSQFIEPEHLFISIFSLEKALACPPAQLGLSENQFAEVRAEHDVISRLGVPCPSLRHAARGLLPKGTCAHQSGGVIHRSAACKEIFARAASRPDVTTIGAPHLLAAILEHPGPLITAALIKVGTSPEAMLKRLFELLANPTAPPAASPNLRETATPFLDQYGRDITKEAREGKLGPFMGRRTELLRIIQTLARSSKNNPVIVGEAGVGKTALVEALALRMVADKDALLGKNRIVELNLGALQGGTKYRGEFEERLANIMAEARTGPGIIVFIDEIHNLIGAGRVEGSMDAANILKPALARGEFCCIGATTVDEYRRHVEKDPALERRFEMIRVEEPSRDETVDMVKGLRPKWEAHYGIRISDAALFAAVDYAIRFDTDHRLPDKAVDLLDKAGARAKIPMLSMRPGAGPAPEKTLAEKEIAEVLSEKTGIPVTIITGYAKDGDGARILDLESRMKSRIFGQDAAIGKICERLRLAFSGIAQRKGPLAVFLALGPTGVGKTETAKVLAELLFGQKSALVRLDMSEFMEEHAAAKLIGSPPGYVGYEEEGRLTGALRKTPHCLVLLDEVEKAHPRIFDLFLQVFDDGRLTDAKGRTADAKNAVFFLTSNIVIETSGHGNIGFVAAKEKEEDALIATLRQFFRKELINRLDEVLVFGPLDPKSVAAMTQKICQDMFAAIKTRYGVQLEISEDALAFLAKSGHNPEFGARNLKRTVERLLQSPLSRHVLSGKLLTQPKWRIAIQKRSLTLRPVR